MLFERTAREQALEDIRRALSEEIQGVERAEMLAAIAEDFEVPIELVVQWIHVQPPAKPFAMAQFSAFAREMCAGRRATIARFNEQTP